MLRSLLAFSLVYGVPAPLLAQTYTWNGPFTPGSSTNWSAATWGGGTPPIGGGATAVLNFTQPGGDTTGYIAVNDLGANFQANQINFTSLGGTTSVNDGNGITPSAVAISVTGTAPQVNQNAYGKVVLNYVTFNNPTTIAWAGAGELVVGTGTYSAAVTVNRPTPYQNVGFTTFSNLGSGAGTTGAGGVTVQAGNVRLRDPNPLGTGPVTVNGGAFVSDGASTKLANNITLNADFVYGGDRNNPGSLTLTGLLSGTGGVRTTDALGLGDSSQRLGGLYLFGTNTYTGATGTAFAPYAGQPRGGAAADIVVAGPTGSIRNTLAIQMLAGGTFTLDNSIDAAGNFGSADNNTDRLGDRTPVTLNGGSFVMIGTLNTASSETTGVVTGNGHSRVTVDASATGNAGTTLTFAALSRGASRGTFLFQGNNANFGGAGGGGGEPAVRDRPDRGPGRRGRAGGEHHRLDPPVRHRPDRPPACSRTQPRNS